MGQRFLALLGIGFFIFMTSHASAQTCRELFHFSASEKTHELAQNDVPFQQKTDFQFVTWNMLSLFISDGTQKAGETIGRFTVKSPQEVKVIADVIRKNKASILVAEETEIHSLKRLDAQELGDKYDEYTSAGNDSAGIEIGFMVRKSLGLKGEIESHINDTWLNITTNPPSVQKVFARDLPVLRLWKQESDGSIDRNKAPALIAVGAHFKSKRDAEGDPESYVWRLQHGLRTYQILRDLDLQYDKKVPILLGGDFNDVVNESAALRPIGLLLSESFSLAGRVGEAYAPYNATHTYHARQQPVQAHQMDAIYMNDAMAIHMTDSAPYHYLDPVTNTPKLYPKFAGNQMDFSPYPNTYEQRSKNPSDHKPDWARSDITKVNPHFHSSNLRTQFLQLQKNFLEQVYRKTGSIDSNQNVRVRFHLEEGKTTQDLPAWLNARYIRGFLAAKSPNNGKALDLELRTVDFEFFFLSSIVFGDLKYISEVEVL